jgi:ubiquitin-activating enzyme E1
MQDDDTNYHMDLIVGLANMRERNYSILEVDKLKAKFIAGRIIPAIETTTAMATSLVCLELYKVILVHKVEKYRNSFENLALPLFSMAEAVPPNVTKHGNLTWSIWDRWVIHGNPTIQGLLDWFKAKGLDPYSVTWGNTLIYNNLFPNHKERLDKKVINLVQNMAKIEISTHSHHFDIDVSCEDEDENDIILPSISIYFI